MSKVEKPLATLDPETTISLETEYPDRHSKYRRPVYWGVACGTFM